MRSHNEHAAGKGCYASFVYRWGARPYVAGRWPETVQRCAGPVGILIGHRIPYIWRHNGKVDGWTVCVKAPDPRICPRLNHHAIVRG